MDEYPVHYYTMGRHAEFWQKSKSFPPFEKVSYEKFYFTSEKKLTQQKLDLNNKTKEEGKAGQKEGGGEN